MRTLRLLDLIGPPSEWEGMSAIDLDWLIALDSQIKEWQNEASNASSVSSSGGRAVSVEEYEAITRRRDGSDGVS